MKKIKTHHIEAQRYLEEYEELKEISNQLKEIAINAVGEEYKTSERKNLQNENSVTEEQNNSHNEKKNNQS